MITDLSANFIHLREKSIKGRSELKEHILYFIKVSKFKGKCVICDSDPVGLEDTIFL